MVFQVQVRLEKCANDEATCLCAAMIRAGQSLFILDTCGNRNQVGQVTGDRLPPRAKLYDCDEDRNNMIILMSGKTYTVLYSHIQFISKSLLQVMKMFKRRRLYANNGC